MKINYTKASIVILILLGIFFRIYKWSQFDMFAGDEGIQLIYAEDILNADYFTVTGEVSSLDQDGEYILHNSPLGIYFQSFLYLFSFKSAKIYSLTYVFLNVFSIILLYKAVKYIAHKKTAVFSLVLMLFSPFMIRASVWTSQPVNSLFFESIAIFLIAKFLKTKNEKLFLWGSIFTLIATQMYPPMYLLIIPKLVLGLYLFNKKIRNRTEYLANIFLATIIIYLPYLIMEIKYNWINTNSILDFINGLKNASTQTQSLEQISYLSKISNLNKKVIQYFSLSFRNNEIYIFIYLLLVTIGTFYRSSKEEIKKLNFSFFIMIFPILLLYGLFSKSSVSGDRAYIDIIFPFLLMFVAIIHNKISKKIISIFLIIYVCVTVLPMSDYFFRRSSSQVTLQTLEKSVDYIINDARTKNLDYPVIHVVSEGDPWGWDGSIYWYLIEQRLNLNLVSIDFYSSKAKLNSPFTIGNYIYLVCHNFDEDKCLSDWEKISNTGYYNLVGKYNLTNKKTINQNTIFTFNNIK